MKLADTYGPSTWIDVPQEKTDPFAEATGDHQWIHVDPARATVERAGGDKAVCVAEVVFRYYT
jgi:acyl dehydratase